MYFQTMLARTLLHGPMIGASIGFLQSAAALEVVHHYGARCPYFRGPVYFTLHMIVVGAFVGSILGIALAFFEHYLQRRIRVLIVLPVLIPIGCATEAMIADMVITHGGVEDEYEACLFLAQKLFIVLFGLVLSIATSRRSSSLVQGSNR